MKKTGWRWSITSLGRSTELLKAQPSTFWGTDDLNADLNTDGIVDVQDLLLILSMDLDPDFDITNFLLYLAARADDFVVQESQEGGDSFEYTDLMWRIITWWGTSDEVADVTGDGVVNMADFLAAMRMAGIPDLARDDAIALIIQVYGEPGPLVYTFPTSEQTQAPRPDHNLYPNDDPDNDLTPGGDSCPFDCANHDGVVDVVDLLELLGEWGTPGPYDCDVAGPDLEPVGDGTIDVSDLLALLTAWGICR